MYIYLHVCVLACVCCVVLCCVVLCCAVLCCVVLCCVCVRVRVYTRARVCVAATKHALRRCCKQERVGSDTQRSHVAAHTDTPTHRDTQRHTETHRDTPTHRHTDTRRHTDTQRDTQRDTDTQTQTHESAKALISGAAVEHAPGTGPGHQASGTAGARGREGAGRGGRPGRGGQAPATRSRITTERTAP